MHVMRRDTAIFFLDKNNVKRLDETYVYLYRARTEQYCRMCTYIPAVVVRACVENNIDVMILYHNNDTATTMTTRRSKSDERKKKPVRRRCGGRPRGPFHRHARATLETTAHHQPAVIGGWGGLYHVNGLWSANGCGNVHGDGLVRPMRGGSMVNIGGGGSDWSCSGGSDGGPGDGAPRLMLDSEPVLLAAPGDMDRLRFRCRPPECANWAANCCCCILRTREAKTVKPMSTTEFRVLYYNDMTYCYYEVCLRHLRLTVYIYIRICYWMYRLCADSDRIRGLRATGCRQHVRVIWRGYTVCI